MCAPIKKPNSTSGYVALITAILISVSLLILTVAVSFEGFHSRFSILESNLKEESVYLAEACANLVILELAQNLNYNLTGERTVAGDKTCEVISITQGTFPNIRELEVKGTSGDAVTNLYVEADFLNSPAVEIDAWEEVGNF